MIEILSLPEGACAPQKPVGGLGGEGLPGMQYVFQLMFAAGGKYHMDVIRHHAPGNEAKTLSLKVPDGVGNNSSNSRVTHVALPESAVETPFGLSKDGAQVVEALGVPGRSRADLPRFFNCQALLMELLDQFSGK